MTGATSGIGQVAAERLAASGARIVQVARDPARGEAALARLEALAPGLDHRIHHADLSRLAEMRRVGEAIADSESRIDVLINNAGALFNRRRVSADGFELTFALNHLAYVVLTHALRGRLVETAGRAGEARVVNTASDAHVGAALDFQDLQSTRGYSGIAAYRRSKLANILFTRELARRLAGTGVSANCLHPGFVRTRFGDSSGGAMAFLIRAAKLFAISPEAGAETIVHLAASPAISGATGGYFVRSRPKTPSREARDDAAARRLWDETARLAGIAW
ncbi:MAG: SDR family NAD(P)-dependent oxidoreductase [Alphaproteobacteria bacterium]